jgi:rRNA small subunit pseudouridine methyltransferase Nep1
MSHVIWTSDQPDDLPAKIGARKAPKMPRNRFERDSQKRLVIVLEACWLESVKVGHHYELLNCDDHKGFLRKRGEDYADCRPDIAHQCLLTLMDSPLNRAGLLQVYLRTRHGTLIEMHPQTRVPRSFWLFSKMMVQLMKSLKVRAVGAPFSLMRTIRNPITDHLPAGRKKYGTSLHANKKVRVEEWVDALPDETVVIVIGGVSRGSPVPDYVDDTVCISDHPLSASVVCSKFLNAFESRWVKDPDEV